MDECKPLAHGGTLMSLIYDDGRPESMPPPRTLADKNKRRSLLSEAGPGGYCSDTRHVIGCRFVHVTDARSKAWCLLTHARASLYLFPTLIS